MTPIPTSERLPEVDTSVLFWHTPSNRWCLGWRREDIPAWDDGRYVYGHEFVTHWMPLPERPQ